MTTPNHEGFDPNCWLCQLRNRTGSYGHSAPVAESCLGCGQIGTPSTTHVPTGIYLCAERCVPALAAQPAAGEGLTVRPEWIASIDDAATILKGQGRYGLVTRLDRLRAALQPASEGEETTRA